MMKLFYIVQGELLKGGVIEAQVIASLRDQSRLPGQPRTRLLFLEPVRVAFSARARARLNEYRSMWPAGDIRVVPFVSRFGHASPGRSLAAYLATERLSGSPLVFHCRGPIATWSGHVARRLLGRGGLVFDVRDHFPLETIHRLGSPRLAALTERARRGYDAACASEARAALVADRLFVVSAGLKTYAVETLGRRHAEVHVVPSCVNDLGFDGDVRWRLRAEWRIPEDAPVLVYSGRLGPERLPHLMFRLFRQVLSQRPHARLLLFLYRNDLDDLSALLASAGVPAQSVLIESDARDRVLSRLCVGDVGLLFCEPADRYETWFPIKFPEYLSAGLAVALNPLVGSLPALVRSRGIGWVIDHSADDAALGQMAEQLLSDLETDPDGFRHRSLQTCSELFLWRRYVTHIRQSYQTAVDGASMRLAQVPSTARTADGQS